MNVTTALALTATALTIATGPTADAAVERPPRTALTFTVDDCEGCEIQLHQAPWASQVRPVRDGRVTFRIPSRRTWGMSATVRAPWEGHTGNLTTVAFRYDGRSVGDPVTPAQARSADAASACWAGTRRSAVTVPLVVERVRVAGVRREVPGSIAYTPTTEDWTGDVRPAPDGVLGSQDLDRCDRG